MNYSTEFLYAAKFAGMSPENFYKKSVASIEKDRQDRQAYFEMGVLEKDEFFRRNRGR